MRQSPELGLEMSLLKKNWSHKLAWFGYIGIIPDL
jgi:hypothetical protein